MVQETTDWCGFADITDPDEAACVLIEWYGAAAAGAAANCAATALTDHRDADHRFWIAVVACISGTDKKKTQIQPPLTRPTGDCTRSPAGKRLSTRTT